VLFYLANLPDRRAVLYQKYMRGWILVVARKIHSGMSSTYFLNFMKMKSVKFGLNFYRAAWNADEVLR